jgi:hypothetical protein
MSYLVNNQIWLNLLVDDRHYFYIFLSMIAILAPKKKSYKKRCYEVNERDGNGINSYCVNVS